MYEGAKQTLEALAANGAELFLATNTQPKLATVNLTAKNGIAGQFTRSEPELPPTCAYLEARDAARTDSANGVCAERAVMVGVTPE